MLRYNDRQQAGFCMAHSSVVGIGEYNHMLYWGDWWARPSQWHHLPWMKRTRGSEVNEGQQTSHINTDLPHIALTSPVLNKSKTQEIKVHSCVFERLRCCRIFSSLFDYINHRVQTASQPETCLSYISRSDACFCDDYCWNWQISAVIY